MSRGTRAAVLAVVAGLVLALGSGAVSVWFHTAQEADRRAEVERNRPEAPTAFPDPFAGPGRR
ncbi:hypothetical protein ACFPZ0_21330 [Streptomonospora nanhaiensis]|uniref:Uncharacterized protein n=1 Tax=Streptomonospora nanhaiensis TaxID=1323731 RepID=A0A853BR97_9ACTN|nr:hypothetical protein [Streptomonospora nanhaiensis]MBV2364328.1 hypothetical protein [Streptomonospora nanhaiensis]MBX9390583.1 hypothetical protein [Streptomonospora nanhaiensis]NYI97216.1 hypothetical protein [Streptomonospora nanhaiensis]